MFEYSLNSQNSFPLFLLLQKWQKIVKNCVDFYNHQNTQMISITSKYSDDFNNHQNTQNKKIICSPFNMIILTDKHSKILSVHRNLAKHSFWGRGKINLKR